MNGGIFTIIFAIDPGTDAEIPPRHGQLASFTENSRQSVYKLVYHNEPAQATGNDETHDWREEITILVENQVRQIIGTYRFNDLYAPFDLSREPRLEYRVPLINQRFLGNTLDDGHVPA